MSNLSQFIGGGGLWNHQNFTASGFFDVPMGVSVLKVMLVGGGGGGASYNDYNNGYNSAGGGGGEILLREVGVTPLSRIYVVVGAGGAGAAPNTSSGSDGQPTYLTYTNGGAISTAFLRARGGWGAYRGSPGMGGGYPDGATSDNTIGEIANRAALSSSGESSFGGIGGLYSYFELYNGGSVSGFGTGGTSFTGNGGGGGGASFGDGGAGGNGTGIAGSSAAANSGGGGGGSYGGQAGNGGSGYARIYWVK